MVYAEYIQNGTGLTESSGWNILLGYTPSTTANVAMRTKIEAPNNRFNGDCLIGAKGGNGNFFRFFGHKANQMTFDCPNDSEGRVYTSYTGTTEWDMSWTNGTLTLTNLTANLTTTGSTYRTATFTEEWSVWLNSVQENTKIYYIEAYENGVKVKDWRPALDNQNKVCLYEKIGGTFHYPTDKTPIIGPLLSSINVTPSKTSLKATGETINIVVDCGNAWTVTGDTFLTLSSTGDTGSTTITATAPSYSGATVRTDTLTFTDTVTGDEIEVTIKQRNYSLGQPFYLGADEVVECYLGDDTVSEAYLGEDLVFSSGPFQGLKIKPKTISFNTEGLTTEITIKSSESWDITTLPAWVSASSTSGDSGETTITLTATTQTADTQGTIVVDSANYSASANVNFYVVQFINYIHSQTMNNNRDEYLVTSIYPTLSTKGEILLQHKGYITGNALVGMYGNAGSWDNQDWRLFTYQTKWNMDVGGPRVANNLGGIYNGQDYDISFGNHYIINNDNSQSVTGATQSSTLDNLPIKICLGVVWVKEVKLWEGETLIFDGKAAKQGSQYGLFDLVSRTLLTTNDFTIVGEE